MLLSVLFYAFLFCLKTRRMIERGEGGPSLVCFTLSFHVCLRFPRFARVHVGTCVANVRPCGQTNATRDRPEHVLL